MNSEEKVNKVVSMLELIAWIKEHETTYHFKNLEDRTEAELELIKRVMEKEMTLNQVQGDRNG